LIKKEQKTRFLQNSVFFDQWWFFCK